MISTGDRPSWTTVTCVNPREAPLVGPGHISAVRNDSLYIFGERHVSSSRNSAVLRGSPSNCFYEFNFSRQEWSLVQGNGAAPCARKSHTAVIHKDSFYVFGGYDGDKRLNDFYSYNFLTQTWTNVFVNAGQTPTPRYGHAAVVYENAMYVFGGSDNHYDRESMSSRSSSEYGRSDSGRHVNDMHSFSLESNMWSLIHTSGEVPYPRERASMLVHKNTCLLFGGYDNDLGYLNDVHVFNFDSHVWSTLETNGTAPSGCHSPLALAHSNSMFVFGGKTGPDLYELDLETNTWEPVECDGASPNSNHPAGCVYNGDLFILGGDSTSTIFKQIRIPEKKATEEKEEGLEEKEEKKEKEEKEEALEEKEPVPDDVPPKDEGTIMSYLRSLVNNELMSDVTFIVEGSPVFGHKNLCVRCNYFKAMFTGKMMESTATNVEITDLSRSTFLSLLEYVYTDRLDVSNDELRDLFIAADRYGIESLKEICAQRLSKAMTIENVASILQAADQYNSSTLRDECFAFTLKNFDTVSKTPCFLEMARTNIELALQILQSR